MYHVSDLYAAFTRSQGVSTDSRQSQEGKLFFALRGDRFDGNDYALQALDEGAVGAVVDRPDLDGHDRCLYVKNTLTALQRLAHHHRIEMNIPVIAITGTNGKTTTKELIRSVLSQKYLICATRGNLNNHIGVPLTLLEISDTTQIAIVEMGANHPGEIGWLCQIAAPTVGLVTNVGKAHLEGFGTAGRIWETKMDLYRYLDARNAPVLINEEEPSLDPLKSVLFGRPVRFDSNHLPGDLTSISFEDLETSIRATIQNGKGYRESCITGLYGRHNHHNILSAVAVGAFLQVPFAGILRGLSEYQATLNRSQVMVKGTNTFYLDAYNANPTSMRMALNFFSELKGPGKIVILGDMMELGAESDMLHREILQLALSTGSFDRIFLVGNRFTKSLGHRYDPEKVKLFKDAAAVSEYLKSHPFTDTRFLVKGSRAMQLETILQ
jgi:UDP-N-acetylmuramoyl-tripeptide--D-alanyl-D-alanine ligase